MAGALGRAPRSPALKRLVSRLWYVADETRAGWEVKLPTTSAQIIINLDSDSLTTGVPGSSRLLRAGPAGFAPIAARAVRLDLRDQRRTAGIVLRPEATAAIAGVAADELDLLVDLDELRREQVGPILDATGGAPSGHRVLDALEEHLVCAWTGTIEPDAVSAAAVALLRRGLAVADVADRLGVSNSALTRRFRARVGPTPKRFQRLLRLERTISLATGDVPSWALVAARSGFADQAHLVHDFRELTGMTPADWSALLENDPYHLRA